MSEIGTRSTAIDSTISGSSGLAEPSPTIAMIKSAAWAMTEVVTPAFIASFDLVLRCDQADLGEPGRTEDAHDLHHRPIIRSLVTTHIDALVGAVHGLHLDRVDQPLDLHRLVAQINVAARRHRYG